MSKMYMVSSNYNFFYPDRISRTDQIREVDLIDPRPATTKRVSATYLADKMQNKKVLIVVHGYRNSYEDTCHAYNRIKQKVDSDIGKYDEVIGYMWPGGTKKLSYFSAKRRAKQLRQRIADLLDGLLNETSQVDIMAHSLGCYMSLSALKRTRNKVNNIFLMAPAISDYEPCEGGIFYMPIKSRAEGTFIFRSEDDTVLRDYFPIAERGCTALGYLGPRSLDCLPNNSVVINCSNQTDRIDHASYLTRSEIYKRISRLREASGMDMEENL